MVLMRYLLVCVLVLFAGSTTPSFSQFGKNKMQYDSFEWKYITTDHFDVYFHQGGEYLARYAGVVAERALADFQKELRFSITERITFIVYNSHNGFEQTNVVYSFLSEGVGGVTELFKNRVVVPFQGDWAQYEHVIEHELVHAVLNDMFYGGSIQNAIVNQIQVELPLWMNEGLAEYLSAKGLDTETDMFIRDMAMNENLPEPNEMNGYLAYRGGQTVYWYIADTYGPSKVGELINNVLATGRVNAAFEETFGMTLKEFTAEFKADLKKYYYPDITTYERLKDIAERLTDHEEDGGFYNTSPEISPDGKKAIFISDRGLFFGLYVMDLDNPKEVREVLSSGRANDFEELNFLTPGISWAPDSRRIAVSAKAGGNDALFVVDTESGDEEKYDLGFKSMNSVTWSPDGRYIAFSATVNEQPDLFLFEVESEKVTRLTNDIFSETIPKWNVESSGVFFVSDRGDELSVGRINGDNFEMWNYDVDVSDIYFLSLGARDAERLTFTPEAVETSIAVLPTGDDIWFSSDESGISNIYQLNIASGNIVGKTNALNGVKQIELSNDGSTLLFSSQDDLGYDLYRIDNPLTTLKDVTPVPTTFVKQRNSSSKSAAVQPNSNVNLGGMRMSVNPNTTTSQSASSSSSLDNADFPVYDYKIHFTQDLMTGNVGMNTFYGVQGVQGQIQMLFSDMLGDHQLYFGAYMLTSLDNSNFYLSYNYLPNRVDYSFAAFHSATYVTEGTSLFGPRKKYRYLGAEAQARYPFSKYSRAELQMSVVHTSSENVDTPGIGDETSTHLAPSLGWVYDDVLFGWTGGFEGTRLYVKFDGTPKLGNGDLDIGFGRISTDIRKYFHIGSGFVVASRLFGGTSFGANPPKFFLGGEQGWLNREFFANELPYETATELYFMKPVYPLRGFAVNQIRGENVLSGNVEFRLPLFFLLFADVGAAWTDSFDMDAVTYDQDLNEVPRDFVWSTGVGIRLFPIGLPLKIDVAWPNRFGHFGKPCWLFSLGQDF